MKSALIAFAGAALIAAQIPDQDSRNTNIPDMNTHFQMPVFATREAWIEKAAFLRKQILSSAGLLPMPAKAPIRVQVFDKLTRPGYTVEKLLLETYPGFYLGGNLYRPLGKQGPFPAVVSPHGHWAYGRLENAPLVSVPMRCINMARQGFVVFTYDMVGYNDTNQFPHGDNNGPKLGGPREDLWSINTMGLQLWNSIRAVDFVSSLPEVDAGRIAATGASGGGTQTFLLMAVDDRIKVAAPVNMISAIMQGNDCEEAPNLRVGAFNSMFGAMMAPRPLLMVSASGDWTRNTPKEEFPAVQSIYKLMGVPQNVENAHIDQPHNYSKESREAVYTFFNARMLGTKGPIEEQRARVEQPQDLLALFGRTRPSDAVTMEQYIAARISEANRGIAELQPHNGAGLEKARAEFFERLTFSLLAVKPTPGEVTTVKKQNLDNGELLVLSRAGKGERIPAVWLPQPKAGATVTPTLIVHPEGVAWLMLSARSPGGIVKRILDRGGVVLGIDAFQTGSAKAPRDRKKRAFTVFNQTDDANRVQDILTALTYLQTRSGAKVVNLVGLEMGGVWSYYARALAGPGINLAADLMQFRADSDQEFLDRFFSPGLRKAGDFRAAAVLNTRDKLLLSNAAPEFPSAWVRQSAQAAATSAEVRTAPVPDAALLEWLTSERPR